jgi:hypothetical protein
MTRKTTTKKPSQLDRIETKLGAMDAFVSTTLPAMFNEFRTMESKLDLLLKGSDFMKEIGEKEEPWVPGLGESVTTTMPHVFGVVTGLHSAGGIDIITVKHSGGTGNWNERNVFKATPLEVQKYEEQVKAQEQEAKIAKLKFGTRVEYEDDRGWKVAMDKPTPDGLYVIVKDGHARMAWAKDSQLTIIDP